MAAGASVGAVLEIDFGAEVDRGVDNLLFLLATLLDLANTSSNLRLIESFKGLELNTEGGCPKAANTPGLPPRPSVEHSSFVGLSTGYPAVIL